MSNEEIYESFRNPPNSCSQIPFWFLNSRVDGNEYCRQIEEMARQGVMQAMPHPRNGMDRRDYLTEKYWSAMEKLIRRASEMDFAIHLYDEFNWSSGPAGGKVTADTQNRGLGISMRAKTLNGPTRVIFDDCDDRLLRKGMLTNWSVRENYMRVLLVPLAEDDTLDFRAAAELAVPAPSENEVGIDIPEGRFEAIVLFTVRTNHPSPIPPGTGGLIDYLSPEPTRKFIEYTHEQYAKRFQNYFGTTIKSIYYDEAGPFSAGCFTWTNRFPEEFRQLKGYDIVENIHHLFYDADDTTEKVRCDYWDVVAHLFTENFIGQIADWCSEHGIALTGHSFEEILRWTWAADPYRLLRRQQWPGTDSLGDYKNYSEIKLAQGVSHISGKRVLVCEAVGGMDGWAATLRKTKQAYNQLAVAGVTHAVPHAFFQSAESAKSECPPTFFFQNPYWKYYRILAEMTARQNWINRQGVHVADIAVFYPLVSWWGDGKGGRAYGLPQGHAVGLYGRRWNETPEDPKIFNSIIDTLMRNQLDHDVIDSQGLEEASIRDGKISIAGEQFRVLVVPPMNTIRASDVRRFRDLLDAGGILVVVGRWPSISMENGRNDESLLSTVKELRSKAHTVQDADSLVDLLRDLIDPDITVTDGKREAIDACHRRITDDDGRITDVYLIFNIQPVENTVSLKLRATGQAAVWNSETGEAFRAEGKSDGNGTEITLRLGPYEAPYVVIGENVDEGLPALPAETIDTPVKTLQVNGTWLFKPLPGETPNFKSYGHVMITVPVHVFRTTQIYDEDPAVFDPKIWKEFYLPQFDDSDWDLVHCARKPLLFDDWYGSRIFRTVIPLGADAIKLPVPINCQYVLYVDGIRVRVVTEHTETESGWLDIPYREGKPGVLAVECRSTAQQYGITGPFEFRCHPQEVEPGSWVDHGLWWYSGFGQYDKEIEIPDDGGKKLILNLGEVKESAEVWVNSRFVGARIWPPYSFDITPYVISGKNNVRVIAANSVSNRMFWAEAGRRDQIPEICPSGLLGPIRIDYYDADLESYSR